MANKCYKRIAEIADQRRVNGDIDDMIVEITEEEFSSLVDLFKIPFDRIDGIKYRIIWNG